MREWLQSKPEVIAYVRSRYSSESRPDWVGVIEGDVDYREYLKSKGVTVPTVAAGDRGSMDDTADDGSNDNGSMEDEVVAEGILSAQPSTRVANDNESQAVTDIREPLQTPTRSRSPQAAVEAVVNKPPTPVDKSPPQVAQKAELPTPIVTVKNKALPVKICKGSEVEVVEVSRARQVMQERMVNAQPHDPNMVRLPDGSWGHLQETSTGY